ncbi:MAG: hypothetical protein AB8B83_05840 [Bdellovibrionales bacterium]
MKKILMLAAAIFAFGATPVLADGHGEGGKGKKFEKHDTNGDGVISKDEFLDHASERFSKMDSNSDGTISKEEAKAGHEKRRAEMKERMKERKAKRDAAE